MDNKLRFLGFDCSLLITRHSVEFAASWVINIYSIDISCVILDNQIF